MSFAVKRVDISALAYLQIVKLVAEHESAQAELFGVYGDNSVEVTEVSKLSREDEDKHTDRHPEYANFNLDVRRLGWFSSRNSRGVEDIADLARLFNNAAAAPFSVVMVYD
jgi:hypothetical protein